MGGGSLKIIGSDFSVDDENYDLRPGGATFEANGKVYRPSQDCRRVYGGALDINELSAFPPNEKTVMHIEPQDINIDDARLKKPLNGFHTYNISEHYELIDIQYERFSLKHFLKRVIKYLLKPVNAAISSFGRTQ